MSIPTGHNLGPYEILSLIGTGGMGEVYRARDTRLQRIVALKLVRHDLAQRAGFRDRLQREARAISSLNHPYICSLYDIGEQEGLDYLVMEYVEGETLADVLTKGPLPTDQVLRYGSQIAQALSAAHAHGIIHRDLKPSNIMITPSGAKVLDFGLAKRSEPAVAMADAPTVAADAATGVGQILGTVAYMAPEQAEGRPVDARTDIFALGVVLYEMLSGRQPFRGDTTLSTLASILREEPQRPRQQRPEIPAALEQVVMRCLAKKPELRYGTAAEVERELERLRVPAPAGVMASKRLLVALAILLTVALGFVGLRWYNHASGVRWAENVALPEAAQLVETSRPMAALKLLQQAEEYAPSSPELIRLKEDLPFVSVTIETEPADAEIYATDYLDPDAADFEHWQHLGQSPLKTDRLPRFAGNYRVRAVKSGFVPVESAIFTTGRNSTHRLKLHTTEETPPGMVWIPQAPPVSFTLIGGQLPAVQIPPAWMDKYETTNRQFKEFVDAGGYQKREYWKHPFVRSGKELLWEEAMDAFRDATSRPGPSTWEGGSYPDGKADVPVSGVSWYEAAAYAEFAGKNLPTIYHWYIAAGLGPVTQIKSMSNFGGQEAEPVGSNQGLAPYGTYDMAGNVKEWTANQDGEKRYILGGGWNESNYMFEQADSRSPWDRDATFGFRCVRYMSGIPEALTGAAVIVATTDRAGDKPVDDQTFNVFKRQFSYDKTDLKAMPHSVIDAPHWRREYLSIQAAYGNERLPIHLYLPKGSTPPYQPIFYFAGANALSARTPEEISNRLMEYIVKSGRAVVLPAYAGTLERGPTPFLVPPARSRDLGIQGVKDVSRSIDYLETRSDIDTSKLGFYGLSFGAIAGPLVLGAEPRFKVAILVSGGTTAPVLPEVDPWNYAPRVKIPVLMLNGQDDSMFPLESRQVPFFRALGTPERDKRHKTYPGGHVDFMHRMEVIKEALDWLNQYLGPVETNR